MAKEDNCPVEATLELIGGKYKALILWYLADGRRESSVFRNCVRSLRARPPKC